ncbi:MAG: energy-coupling factor transporter ATPase [Chloroflexi bacterium]|nr:MAG: energy-coupling factor transporter ATPase [Chloroflexota bacterium]
MPTPIIRVDNIHHIYAANTPKPVQALAGVTLDIYPGEYLVILGHNGSGKSTLARHLNGLLAPSQGEVWVKGWKTTDLDHLLAIRSTVGMVFQNPDNQIVATVVEEDVAFGPENLGLPHDEIVRRVDWALERVEMSAQRTRAPHLLSGGQKQRVCVAGILAMKPEVLVLDEATAMLDPLGREEVLRTVARMNREEGTTIVAITHFMHEAIHADRVVVMAEGRIALEGTPREIFRQTERLQELQLDVPQVTQLAQALRKRFPAFPADLLTVEEVVEAVAEAVQKVPIVNGDVRIVNGEGASRVRRGEPLIQAAGLSHRYMVDTPLEVQAIHNIDIAVHRGEIVGIIGHTGSGKSTVIQHFNGLLRAHGGTLTVLGQDLRDPKADVKAIRRRVGLVFQQPEAQLFERYVGDDIAFGPRKLKLSREEVRARVHQAMEAVDLGFEAFKDRMTFTLSGGEKRRAALAGVLALQPEVLVLDEPTAGLDPLGRAHLLRRILALHESGTTLVLISHNMEELAQVCDHIYVIADGRTVMDGPPAAIFGQAEKLSDLHLGVPAVTQVINRVAEMGLVKMETTIFTLQQAVQALAGLLEGSTNGKL